MSRAALIDQIQQAQGTLEKLLGSWLYGFRSEAPPCGTGERIRRTGMLRALPLCYSRGMRLLFWVSHVWKLCSDGAAGLGAGMSEQVFHDAQPEFENFRVHRLGHPPNNMINFSTNWVGRVGEAISSFANDKTLHCERRGRVEQATFVARIGVAVETTP